MRAPPTPSDAKPASLQPDRAELARFINALFMHAAEGGRVSLRAFYDDAQAKKNGDPPFKIVGVRLNGDGLDPLINSAFRLAAEAAREKRPVVLATPLATFKGDKADEKSLLEGLALSVELDERAQEAVARLRQMIGPPTIVIESGGEWTDPASGEVTPKLHAHWRLKETAETPEEHARLKRLRTLACEFVGADATAKTIVHPLRWAGTVHRKNPAAPKLARIVEENAEAEIILEDALVELEGLAELRSTVDPGHGGESATADDNLLMACARRLPNPLPPENEGGPKRGNWPDWNRIGMAFYRASGGTEVGFEAFDIFSKKNEKKYDAEATRARWQHYSTSPPTSIGIGALVYEVRRAEPDFLKSKAKAPERAEIRLTPEHWNRMLAQCADTLRNVLYMRGTVPVMLARAVETGGKEIEDRDGTGIDLNGVRYRPGSLLFMAAVPDRVAWYLDEHATFRRYVRREKEWVAQHCPKEVGASLVDAAIYLGFKPCAGIVHVPLLANGRLITTPGYHEPTGLILDLKGPPPELPQVLDKAAAEAAMERLLRPFRGFLKDGCVDRTAVATAALTAILRASLPTAPAILIDGNNPAVGKGKLARTLSALTTGGLPAVVTEGHSDEETEKRIASAVLQGAPVILLDNLQRHLASSTLESMLTEPVADIRTFGKLENLRVACRALVLMTANNASLRKDMLRRSVPVRIVVQDEKPELRSFDFDPVAEAARDRVELVAAAFTVVLAWLRERDRAENKPHRKPLGSFELWADLVGGAVSWLTGKNPVDLIEEQKEQSPQAADERRVINVLVEWQGKLKDKKGHPRQWWYAKEAAAGLDAELWGGVIEAKGERPSARQVGKWLTRRKDAVFGDYILTGKPDRIGTMEWTCRVCRVSQGMPNTPCEKWQDGESAKSYSANPTNPAKPGKPCKSPDPDDEEGFDL